MKRVLILVLIPLIAAAVYFHFVFHSAPDFHELNYLHKFFAKSVYETFKNEIEKLPKEERAVVDYNHLMNSLKHLEKQFAEKIFSIDPSELGFMGPFYSTEEPGNLVRIESVQVGGRETGINYCPDHSYKDYLLMTAAMKKDTGRKLLIDSGYRSPGRQAYLFFYYLVTSSGYSLKENARWIAMPGYSEHGHPVKNAIDFTSEEGINGFSAGQSAADFTALPEYEWLLENGYKYNFFLSYPEDNRFGVAFEPWHWRWDDGN
jgi:hypothetical protein